MNYLEKLLQGVEVEWKTLREVLVRTKGTQITAGQMKELHKENAPVKIFAGGKTFAMVDFEDLPPKDINIKLSIIVKSRGIIEVLEKICLALDCKVDDILEFTKE